MRCLPISGSGDCSLSEALIAHILDRIDSLVDPVFSLADLPEVAPQDWKRLQKNRMLVQVAEPETVQVKPGHYLAVRKTEHGIFGLDESDEFPRLVKLSASHLLQYRLNIDVFCRQICEVNGFRYVRGKERHGFYSMGRKTLGEQGVATVYFSMSNGDSESIAQRLRMLADGTSLKIVLFACWPDVEAAKFSELGLYVADIQPDLTVAWPLDVSSSASHEFDETYRMILKGGNWTIYYLGETVHTGSAVGLGYIAKALQCSPEPLPMSEWEQELSLSNKDQRDSGGLQARAEPNQNLELTTLESIQKMKQAIELFEEKLAEAKEIDDTESIAEIEGQLEQLNAHQRKTTFRGRPKILGNETARKRLSKNLNTGFRAIDRADERVGKFIRKTVVYENGKLTHQPDDGERWDVRIL